jgi:hypothetical protein
MEINRADVAELVDARDLKSLDGNVVWVRVPPPAPRLTTSEVEMSGEHDDLFDENENEAAEDFNRLTDILFERVTEFANDEEVADDIVPLLLLRLALTTRMMNYAASVAKPSGGGLKLDLDRFRRDIEDLVRESKKNADRFIAETREVIAAARLGEDET